MCNFWSELEFISIQPIVNLYLTRNYIELHNDKMKASKTFKTVIFQVIFFSSKYKWSYLTNNRLLKAQKPLNKQQKLITLLLLLHWK